MMQFTGRRVSAGWKVHIFEDESPEKNIWYTHCGKRVKAQYALPVETVDSSECCTVCQQVLQRVERLKQRN
jgi:hypothetical protein